MTDPIEAYNALAEALSAQYEALDPAALLGPVLDLIPDGASRLALDVGAGSGRDGAWLASKGYAVVAAEPSEGMRTIGMSIHPELRWIDDRLPSLQAVHGLELAYDLVLMGAVWMHVKPTDRPRAFRKVTALLKPGGLLILSLRHGPPPPDRPMYDTTAGEIEALARSHGMMIYRSLERPDELGRSDVSWTHMAIGMPDDGSVGLPLVRGLILGDAKSSTYKLGLLRAVAKAADTASALAIPHATEPDTVLIPMGLVALNWIRMYLPLVSAGLPQAPNNRGPDGLAFAGEGFRKLMALGVQPSDLRIGAAFTGERASAVIAALNEARATIIKNPVRYATLPNAQAQIFTASGTLGRPSGAFMLTPDLLKGWGQLSVPGALWRTLVRMGTWVEPVLLSEWAALSRRYGQSMGLAIPDGAIEARLVWQEPARDTALARAVTQKRMSGGEPIHCVWSNVPLKGLAFDIDHAMPWSAWPCGDLWNLFPATVAVNQRQKRDRLPTASVLQDARASILDWWDRSWLADPALSQRFEAEAAAALPINGSFTPEAAFNGMEWRRLRVQQDQQPPLWGGGGNFGGCR